MLQTEEDLLVMSAQNGNHKAFNVLVLTYQKPLLRFAYTLCNDRELANDAVQDCWIKTSKNLHRLKDPRAFKSWLYRMVKWRTTDLLRVRVNHNTLVKNDPNATELIGSSVQSTNQSELMSAINRLPVLEKEIIRLFYLDEMKVAEIAIILEVPVGTVKSRLSRARKRVKQKLNLS